MSLEVRVTMIVVTLTVLGPICERVKPFHHSRLNVLDEWIKHIPSNFPDVNWSSKRASTAAVFCRLMYFPLLLALILVTSFLVLRAFSWKDYE